MSEKIKSDLGSRYSIQKQLGKKPGRYTYLALDEETKNLVVVKMLKLDRDFEWDSLKLFEREAQILKNLSHPTIPQYLDYFDIYSSDTKGFALVQSYIDAKSLEEQVTTGRTFNEAELKEIAEKMLNILIYLHQRKPSIIHRDIKPSNILLTNRSGNSVGEVYLVDFGSVQNITAVENHTLTVVGTYGYMSPEHFGDRAVPTSDLYSLGATLIYLATGIHPADFLQKDLQIQFADKTQLSEHFTSWLKKVLEPSQEKRFSSAKVALSALQNPEIVNLSFANNVTIKPVGSEIILNKSADKLEIIKPGTGWTLNSFGKLLGNIFISCFALYFVILLWTLPFIKWFMLPFVICIVFSSWGFFLFFRFGKTRLLIDNKIHLTYEMFGIKYQLPHKSLRENIIKLEYNNCLIQENKSSIERISYNYFSQKIVVWAGNEQYQLIGMTPPELHWLLKELSEFLELPIQHRITPLIKSN